MSIIFMIDFSLRFVPNIVKAAKLGAEGADKHVDTYNWCTRMSFDMVASVILGTYFCVSTTFVSIKSEMHFLKVNFLDENKKVFMELKNSEVLLFIK